MWNSNVIVRVFSLLLASVVLCENEGFQKHIYTPEYNFLEVAKFPSFVDKTLLIRQVFEGPKCKLITAPRRFGKSTNLDMLKTFLSVPVDGRGKRDNKTAQQLRNVFETLQIYKQDASFFEEHFARHPVLYVNFATSETLHSRQLAQENIKQCIHDAFYHHRYLCNSTTMKSDDNNTCKLWADEDAYEDFNTDDVILGLYKLAESLFKHYKKKVFILVDEYDAIVSNAIFYLRNESNLKSVIHLVTDVLQRVIKCPFVERIIISGVSYIATTGMNNVQHYGFLDDHAYVDFYGFLEPEVDQLLAKFNVSAKKAADARTLYDGYVSKNGRRVYNPFSILQFLNKNKVGYYWIMSGQVEGLVNIFRYNKIGVYIKRMLGVECIRIEFARNVTTNDIFKLRNLLAGKIKTLENQTDVDMFFYYLFERGYFSYDANEENCIRIPNDEIQREFINKLLLFYTAVYKLDLDLVANCGIFFNAVIPFAKFTGAVIKRQLATFLTVLRDVFNEYAAANGKGVSGQADLKNVMFTVASCATNFIQKSHILQRYQLKNGNTGIDRIDLYVCKRSFAVIIESMYHENTEPNSTAALDRILERRYHSVFKQEKYTRQKVKYFLLIGVSINNKGNLSISGLLNTVDIAQTVTVTG